MNGFKAAELKQQHPEGWFVLERVVRERFTLEINPEFEFPVGCGSVYMLQQIEAGNTLDSDIALWFKAVRELDQ